MQAMLTRDFASRSHAASAFDNSRIGLDLQDPRANLWLFLCEPGMHPRATGGEHLTQFHFLLQFCKHVGPLQNVVTILIALALMACTRRAVVQRPVDAGHRDTTTQGVDAEQVERQKCLIGSRPPAELDDVPPQSLDMVWTGTHYGIVWTEREAQGEGVRFIRVDRSGRAMPPSGLISEMGYRAANVRMLWHDNQFWIVFDSTASGHREVRLARLDARGTRHEASDRFVAKDRADQEPSILRDDANLFLGWASDINMDHNRVLFMVPLNRDGRPTASPTWLDQRHTITRTPRWIHTPEGWTVIFMLTRDNHEALGLDVARFNPALELRGSIVRVTSTDLVGPDEPSRFSVTWDGESFFIAWDELSPNGSHVVWRRMDSKGHMDDVKVLSPPGERASHPSIAALGLNRIAVAWESERRAGPRVRAMMMDAQGHVLGESIEVQDRDGVSSYPVLVPGDNTLGILTQSPSGLRFHLGLFGPCDPSESSSLDAGFSAL